MHVYCHVIAGASGNVDVTAGLARRTVCQRLHRSANISRTVYFLFL